MTRMFKDWDTGKKSRTSSAVDAGVIPSPPCIRGNPHIPANVHPASIHRRIPRYPIPDSMRSLHRHPFNKPAGNIPEPENLVYPVFSRLKKKGTK
jgi:hypothetical protein